MFIESREEKRGGIAEAYEGLKALTQVCREELDGEEALKILSQAAVIIDKAPAYDVIGMEALLSRLRLELKNIHSREDEINSINRLSKQTGVSRTHLAKFRDGGSVGMNIINRVADAFGIQYLVENYEDPRS